MNIAGYELRAWDSVAEKYPALNICGDGAESLSVELYVRGETIVGVQVCDARGYVSKTGLVPPTDED